MLSVNRDQNPRRSLLLHGGDDSTGVWERVFAALIDDPRNEYVMLDATLVRAHQQAATGKGGAKRGAPRTRLWGVPEVD